MSKNTSSSNTIFDLSKKFANLKSASNLFSQGAEQEELVIQVQNSIIDKNTLSQRQSGNDFNADLYVVQDQSA